MEALLVSVVVLCAGLAAANGANDASKAVATLGGAGVTRYRTAIAWGVAATLLGALLSLALAGRVGTLFGSGIVDTAAAGRSLAGIHHVAVFSVSVLVGAIVWVALATASRLPVSTTHAIVGGLIGAGLLLAPQSIRWASIAMQVAAPLLLSVVLSYGISAALARLAHRTPECICIELTPPASAMVPSADAAWNVAVQPMSVTGIPAPQLRMVAAPARRCPMHDHDVRRARIGVNGAHWLSSAAIGFARGLNDTPKIWSVGATALLPLHMAGGQLLAAVALAMAGGGLAAGIRVARRLGDDVVNLSRREGFTASATTALLVGVGAHLGLPMSTTHVATAAIAGIAGGDVRRVHRTTLRDFAIAWTVTPLGAGAVAAAVLLVLGR